MKRESVYRSIISISINLVIVVIAIFIFGAKLYMNDDGGLFYMFFGIITKASSRTFYVNPVLGWIYKQLHLFVPTINWMTLSYYIGLFVSGAAALYSLLKKNNKFLIILWILFELVFFHDVYVYLTFSVVAAFVAWQAYLCLFLNIQEEKPCTILYIIIAICFVFSSMLRFDCFLGVSAFAFVIWMILVLSDVQNKATVKIILSKYIYPFVTILGVCFALLVVDKACYLKGDWKTFSDYESKRLVVTDYRSSIKIERYKPLRERGVTKNQALAIVDFRNNDPEILNIDLVERVAGTTELYNHLFSKYVWKDYIRQWRVIFTKYWEVFFSIFSVAFVTIIWNKGKRWWIPFALFSPLMIELFYFAYMGRLDNGEYPERCIYIVLMGVVLEVIALFSTIEYRFDKKNRLMGVLCTFLIISTIIVQPTKNYSIDGLGLVDTDSIESKYSFICDEDKVYVTHYSFMQDIMSEYGAWQLPPTGYLNHCVEIGGWLINHPMQNELQNSLGCENPYRALFEQDNVYYATKYSTQDSVLEYLQENYDENITCEYIKEKAGVKIYKYGIE